MDNHPLDVDVADLQVSRFSAACSRGIHRHQQDAMKGCIRRLNQLRDFFLTEYPDPNQLKNVGKDEQT
jgi:hypothetical protein